MPFAGHIQNCTPEKFIAFIAQAMSLTFTSHFVINDILQALSELIELLAVRMTRCLLAYLIRNYSN